MGTFFNNLHVRSNGLLTPEQVADYVRSAYTAKGFTPVDSPDEADMHAAVLGGPDDGWISVYSEEFQFSGADDMRALAAEYSAAFQTDALTLLCFDSDFLLMNLVNTSDGADAWMKIGQIYGLKPGRRVNRTAWKNKVSDYAAFTAAVTADYVCAEDALEPIGALLSLNPEHAAMDVDYLVDLESDAPMIRLYFAAPKGEEKRPPKFKRIRYSLLDPLHAPGDDLFMYISVVNTGDATKGLQIVLSGDFVENDEIVFTDMQIVIHAKNWSIQRIPIAMEKVRAMNGQWVLGWTDPNFRIPAGVDDSMPEGLKRANEEMLRSISFSFRAHGDWRKYRDIAVSILPMENMQEGGIGHCSWVW